MPDPMDELEHFTTPGLTMDPLPAAEVRRRGTRLRRRNRALATVGGVAAAAMIATPLAVAVGGQRASDPTPPVATQSSTPAPRPIPADLDLGQGMGDSSTEPRAVASARELADLDLELCGSTVWRASAPAVTDVRSVELANQGSEGGYQRTLAVYDGARSAEEALAAIDSAARACTGVQQGPPAYEVFVVPAGDTGLAATAYVQAFHDADGLTSEGTVVSVVQEGNMLLFDAATTMGAGDDRVRRDAVANLRQRDQGVLEAISPDFEG